MYLSKNIVLFFLLVFISTSHFGQNTNTNCANATPFCTGQTMSFPAVTGTSQAQSGPNYGCLGSQPRPNWFYMQIAQSGSITIAISATWDVDFICYGPFPNLASSCNSLTSGNIQSCSYSGSATETCVIANAVAGQFYLLMVTNFNGSAQNINFFQNNAGQAGAGSTNCGFICLVTATNSGIVCAGNTPTLSLTSSSAVTSYTWTGPSGFSSTSSVAVAPTLTSSTVFTVTASTGSSTCQSTTSCTVVEYPNFNFNPNTYTICQGGSIFVPVVYPVGANTNNTYSWTPGFTAGVLNPAASSTSIGPLSLSPTTTLGTMIFSLTATPVALNCPTTKALTVTINNPLTPSLTLPGPVCNTSVQQLLIATPGGGTWAANPAVTPGGMFNPAAVPNYSSLVTYSVQAGNCIVSNTSTLYVAQYNTAALSGSLNMLCALDGPVNLMALVTNTFSGKWSGQFVNTNTFSPTGIPTNTYTLMYKATSTPSNIPNSPFGLNYANVCPDSTFLNVSVFNPPTPTIVPILPMCTNARTVELKATPLGGTWSQNSGVTSGGIQTPSLCAINVNSVVYTAGIGTCVASSSATFVVAKFVPATLTGTVPNQCVSGNPINLLSIVANTTGVWTGMGINTPYIYSPANLPTGTYKYKYQTFSTPPLAQCQDSSLLYIHVLNPQTPVIQQVGPYCSKSSTIQLQVTPPVGYWTTAAYVTTLGVFVPSLASVGLNHVEYVIGTPTCNVKKGIDIAVEAFVPADIINQVPDLCTTSSPFNLQPITLANSGIWNGPGLSGSIINPLATGSGTFVYQHSTASSPSGLCPDQATIAVRVYSLEVPTITQAGPYCNKSQAVKLQVSPLGGYFSGANNGAVSPAGLFNPANAILGNNIVSYSIASGPCIAFAQSTIEIVEFVSAAITKTLGHVCQNDPAFDLYSLVGDRRGQWTPGPGLLGSMFDPSKALIGNNTFYYATTSPKYSNLCPDQSTLTLEVKEIPTVTAIATEFEGCAPYEVTFNTANSNNGVSNWTFGDNENSKGLTVTHIYNTPGVYTVQVNYEVNGCKTSDILDRSITVHETPDAFFIFSDETPTSANPEIQLINQSTPLGNNKYTWTIDKLNIKPLEISPYVTLTALGVYKVTLLAENENGCKSKYTRSVELKNIFECFIPNVFTPDGDGLNDTFGPVFSPYGLDESSYSLEIFDRWGESLFRTKNFLVQWDGLNFLKQEVKEDVYVYQIRYRDLEGKVYYKTGSVTVVR